MSEKKTILEILQVVVADGDEWAQAAIEAHKNHPTKHFSKSEVILYGFDWKSTPQGFDFWEKVYREEFKKESAHIVNLVQK